MEDLTDWVRRRSATISLVIFFLFWYAIQFAVLKYYGEEIATWWFYFEHTSSGTPILSPGLLLAPISHHLYHLTHIIINILLLLLAGGFVEPHIKKRYIGILVVGFGYFGMYLANATFLIHGFWNIAGTSGGILSLWAFAGLKKRELIFGDRQIESIFSSEWVEQYVAIILLFGTPVLLLHETAISFHSGHAVGILLGYLYYIYQNR